MYTWIATRLALNPFRINVFEAIWATFRKLVAIQLINNCTKIKFTFILGNLVINSISKTTLEGSGRLKTNESFHNGVCNHYYGISYKVSTCLDSATKMRFLEEQNSCHLASHWKSEIPSKKENWFLKMHCVISAWRRPKNWNHHFLTGWVCALGKWKEKESFEIHNHASYDDPNEPVIDYYLGLKMASQLHNAAKESIAIS